MGQAHGLDTGLGQQGSERNRDDLHDPRSSRGSSLVGPLFGNELPVPAQDGVWSDERGDFGKGTAADSFAAHGQSASLIIGQSESSATELLLENSVLLSEILDDCVLMTADPPSQGGDEDLPRLEDGRHRRIVPIPQ